MSLYWTRSRINRADAMWHIGRVDAEPKPGAYFMTAQRLCQPPFDRFWGLKWDLKSHTGGSPEYHPVHPAGKVRICPTCLRRCDDPSAVLPTLPTPEDAAQARYEEAIAFLSGHAYGRAEYENVGAGTLRVQAAKIESIDPDLAADLRRVADDLLIALTRLLGSARKEYIAKLRAARD